MSYAPRASTFPCVPLLRGPVAGRGGLLDGRSELALPERGTPPDEASRTTENTSISTKSISFRGGDLVHAARAQNGVHSRGQGPPKLNERR